jgi:nitroimidazol reductase NimA-like FMN-containing flavoprotein (pyridoxamine 5'-phosphate oxidase superfamily)
MSRRDQIRMSAAEAAEFLAEERTVTCATVGPRGWPHLMPLWYVVRHARDDGPSPRLWAWTYGASQKTLNLERDPRATLQIEAGETYDQLRGVMLECDAIVHRELDVVTALGEAVMLRNSVPPGVDPEPELPSEGRAVIAAQAVKRVALEFVERRRTSWDHRKLGGIY